jgi:hypothetical protein
VAVYIDPAVLAVLLGVVLTGLLTFSAWLVKQVNQHAEYMAAGRVEQRSLEERQDRTEDRVRNLELWRDGVSLGRAVERHARHGDGDDGS